LPAIWHDAGRSRSAQVHRQPPRPGVPDAPKLSGSGLNLEPELLKLEPGTRNLTIRNNMTDDGALFLDELLDAVIGEREQRQQRIVSEWHRLGRSLNLNESAVAGLHDIHVDVGA